MRDPNKYCTASTFRKLIRDQPPSQDIKPEVARGLLAFALSDIDDVTDPSSIYQSLSGIPLAPLACGKVGRWSSGKQFVWATKEQQDLLPAGDAATVFLDHRCGPEITRHFMHRSFRQLYLSAFDAYFFVNRLPQVCATDVHFVSCLCFYSLHCLLPFVGVSRKCYGLIIPFYITLVTSTSHVV
jgi:hypothetical protein